MFPGATIVRPSVLIGTEDRIFNAYAKLAKLAPLIPLPDGGQGKLQPVRLPGLPSQGPLMRHLALRQRPPHAHCQALTTVYDFWRTQVYVRDVATAVVEALKTKATEGKVIELAGPKVYTYGLMP